MKKYIFYLLLSLSGSKTVLAQGTLADEVNHAFSLVGHWEIIKMDVIRNSTVTNPSTVPEATMGTVSVLVSSELGSYGTFDIAPGGSITGSGEVQYNFHVSAGSTAMSVPMTNMVLPVGASAVMEGDDGVRKFSITGSADLEKRTIHLNAFKAEGGGLKMMIHPGNKGFTAVLWPPMTNVESKVIVTGASLLLRASGVLNGIKVSFEAVRYVDLASLFKSIEDLVKNGANGSNGNNGASGNNGTNGSNGSNGTNNTTNNNSNNNNGRNGTNGKNGENGSNENNGSNPNNNSKNQGPQPLVAGTISINFGSAANVVFKIPQATSNYAISLTAMNTSGEQPLVTYSNKSAIGFKINVSKPGNATGQVKIDWIVTPCTN